MNIICIRDSILITRICITLLLNINLGKFMWDDIELFKGHIRIHNSRNDENYDSSS